MEKKSEEMTQEVWDEWNSLVREQECAECGSVLAIYTVPERASLALGCAADHSHAGYRQRTSITEEMRRGAAVLPVIRDKIESKMMVKAELNRALNLLQVRFPSFIKDIAGASLFINDCMRLGLDPLIQPAEAVPIAFHTKDKAGKQKDTVAMIVTEDGYLSMAARGCPEEYDGAPATMPLLDYLMREHAQRPMVELQEVARRTAEELCDDPKAFVWVALGKRRSATVINPVYGYYRQKEWTKAKDDKVPAGTQPGNQARIRAVKRWVRENFPECRQKMLEYTGDLLRRSEGAIEVRRIIDAEYRVIIDITDEKTTLISPPSGGQKAAGQPKTARTTKTKQVDNKVSETAKRATDQTGGRGGAGGVAGGAGGDTTAEPSGADDDTLLSTRHSPEMEPEREASAACGFIKDLDWLKESLDIIKWSDGTARSWIAQKFPGVNTDGTLIEVLKRLTREQSEIFTKELNNRVDNAQSNRQSKFL